MPHSPSGAVVEQDAQGFLLHPEQWTPTWAQEAARESGIGELTDRHWQVVNSMRNAYLDHGSLPWVHMIAKVSGVAIEELYQLFPIGPSRLVTKIGGIPKNRACI